MSTTRIRRACALTAAGMFVMACGTSTSTPPGDLGPADRVDAAEAEVAATCNGGARQPPGGPCRCIADCEPGAVCATEEETGFPGGTCLQACDPAEAPRAGLACETFRESSFYARTCGPTGSAPCRDGWFCRVRTVHPTDRSMDRYRCEPACSSDEQCRTGHCDRYTGFCQAEKDRLPNAAPCTTDMQCRGGVCFASGAGACTSICDARTGFCPDDGVCLPPVQADAGAHNGSCLIGCARLADCPRGFTCMRAMGRGVCVPDRL